MMMMMIVIIFKSPPLVNFMLYFGTCNPYVNLIIVFDNGYPACCVKLF